ncbi:MAG: DUF2288 domain-containing protein [Cyanobacteria bacterium QS_7_48_42]|nr:MAG: DUF2288 domain-containing protein [Cyanobacteria bacterium QH_10_48_56]PSO70928.1 MAG: DUF2288 domain-containing protein [Cyanobacteria bacterium QS_1_48_34]PSO78718.1 MAG: DUF2288 domain-containing protein [Cyanobacteria bacterium QS_5_48_63]PSO82394.1 MAG: DUF2288 domain-containing protein [Cyanobacteria bacterium QS_4_48_99]PSO89836.1 MAG: DUF2288 domain-containing protein [Cyanobacteria bacterium QS_3_48_167]PSO90636.1 MAG: DUF2288 domain-containing protein [Cyanobacteria bacterium
MQDLKAALAESLDEAEWNWLLPHAKRDAVLVVSPVLNLLDVGVAIAQDDVSVVQSWINNEQLHKPSTQQLSDWNANPDKLFSALIVQPYVLVQEQSASSAP